MSGKIKNFLAMTQLLTLAVCLILLVPACSKENKKVEVEKEKEIDKEIDKEKKEFKLEEPPYDITLPGKEGLENMIKAYNFALIKAHISDPYFKLLRKYATNKETERVFVESRYDTDRGLAMRNQLFRLAFENISTSNDSAFVDTSEKWGFEYIDIKTKEVKEPLKNVSYSLRYKLAKEDGRWVVSRIEERQPRVYH